jgi:citrate synthase
MEKRIHTESYVGAEDAIAILGVKRATLYSYVSRGLVRSVPGDGRRARRYVRADLERLRGRRDARSGHAALARSALDWGEPVLDSALTRITEQGPALRGHLVVDLVESGARFEEAAELLWTGTRPVASGRWGTGTLGYRAKRLAALLPVGSPPFAALRVAITALSAAAGPGAIDHAGARTLIARLAASLALGIEPAQSREALAEPSIAATILHALGARPTRAAIRAIDATLVVSVDHELNPSSFVARIAASVDADAHACIAAALATLSGSRHGGACDRVEAFVDEVASKDRASKVIGERLRRGEAIPGFGHRLYPRGDPRAKVLLDLTSAFGRSTPRLETLRAIVRTMHDLGQEPPTLDAGLVAIAAALGLPQGSAIALFAIGRTAGWIAHMIEQRQSGQLLRPRARYVG